MSVPDAAGIQSSPEAKGTQSYWTVRQVVGDCYCVVDREGRPVVAAPLSKSLADLIAIAPEMALFVKALDGASRSIDADGDGDREYTVSSELAAFLSDLSERLSSIVKYDR